MREGVNVPDVIFMAFPSHDKLASGGQRFAPTTSGTLLGIRGFGG